MKTVQNRLMKKVILALLILLFLFVFATAFVSYVVIAQKLSHELISTNMQLLKQIDHKFNLTLKNIDKAAFQMLGYQEIRKFFDVEQTEHELRENAYKIDKITNSLINSDEYVFSVDLYSYKHQRLLSGNVPIDENPMKDYEWVTQFEHYDGFANWLPMRRLLIRGGNYPIYSNVVTLVRTYPIIHSDGFRRGAIAVNIKEDALYSLLGNERDPRSDYNFIIDGSGQIVLHHDESKLGKDISEFSYISAVLQNGREEGYVHADVEGKNSTVFYVTSGYTGWKLIRVVPVIAQQQAMVAMRNTLLAIASVLFAAAAAAGIGVGLWTLKPINRFMTSISKKLTTHPLHDSGRKYADEFLYFESIVQNILNDSERLHRQMAESRPIVKWRLLMELLSNYRVNFKNVKRYMEMNGILLYPNRFIVMSVEFDNKAEIAEPRDLLLYAYALCNVAEELMNAESRGAAIELENGQCAIIMSFDEDDDAEKYVIRAVAVADLIKNFVQEYFKRTVTIGIGGRVHSMKDIHLSYKQSQEALKYKLIMGNNTIITADDIEGYHSAEFHRLFAMTDSIIDALKMADAEKMRHHAKRWFDAFMQHNVPPDMIKQLNVQCLMNAATLAGEIGVGPEDLAPSQNIYEALNQYESLDQIKQFLISTLEDFIGKIKAKRSSREKNDTIENVMQFIREHYMRSDLSLNYLADKFDVSVSHLSKMFKEFTSRNFIDYLMEIRIHKSKELLAETEVKIREVAESVGYTNVNSFVRIFKKMTGLTPGEYRERERSKKE
ncbi:helix-turn-helix domain-containing protein [Paenibacillus alkalitolerans]|uniref:helix-turn-helix domain-containing protein n=1 Tax=Paenibacillus alkalitolerans TaxID=2799335 RepID=UPI0018F59D92|nr:helix-turn-helix domain-containing protein [Paenibacillus alkalitolerans]